MTLALDRHKILLEKGEWLKKLPQELEFIAMKSELEETKKRLQQTKKPDTVNKEKAKQKKAARDAGRFAWKAVAPKPGEPTEKIVDGTECIHCPHHKDTHWVLKINKHGVVHTEKCLARQKQEQQKKAVTSDVTAATNLTLNAATSNGTNLTPTKEQMSCARALVSVMEQDISVLTEESLPMKG